MTSKFLKLLALALALAMAITCVFAGCGNNEDSAKDGEKGADGGVLAEDYEKPIEALINQLNSSDTFISNAENKIDLFGGFGKELLTEFNNFYKETSFYDLAKDDYENRIDIFVDSYGDDFKISYKITKAKKVEAADLNKINDDLLNYSDLLSYDVSDAEEYDDSDWEDAAKFLDLTVEQAKEYVSFMEKASALYADAEATEGYELTIELTINGSKLDEPETATTGKTVYKVNGSWVLEDVLRKPISLEDGWGGIIE